MIVVNAQGFAKRKGVLPLGVLDALSLAPHRLAGPDRRCVASLFSTLHWVIGDLDGQVADPLEECVSSSTAESKPVIEALVGRS